MKQLVILALFSVAVSQPAIVSGYLRGEIEMSYCMDACSHYYIDNEVDFEPIAIIFPDTFDDIDLYVNRFVEVGIGQEVTCVECSAYEVESIALSDDCMFPVLCIVDPCEVAPECQIFTPTECVANYCGGCYADFYDPNGNLVDCPSIFPIEDCEDIEENYSALHSGVYAECEYDIDCMPVWGHCDVSLGGCHYAVNASNYPEEEINEQVDLWIENDCMTSVCDCMDLPYAVCNSGECELAYCDEPNPAGCVQTGCAEGYSCINDPDYCASSDCDCTASGQWICDMNCNGGTCFPMQTLGDINNDSEVNVLDIVLIVSFILMTDSPTDAEFSAGDINSDEELNVLDVVAIVQMILNPEASIQLYSGTSLGWCSGYCSHNLELDNGSVSFISSGFGVYGDDLTDIFLEDNLNQDTWQQLVELIDFEYFQSLDDIYGYPNSDDASAEYIEIIYNGVSKEVIFDADSEVSGIEELTLLLRELREDYQNQAKCYIEPVVGPCDGICPTYYFNQNTDQCEEFITGCCGVEAFNTMGDCINTCE